MSGLSIRYTSQARRDLRRLDRQVAGRVVLAIERLSEGDRRSDIKKLSGTNEYRLRAGEWRVRFQHNIAAKEIVVLRILPRGRAYDR